MEDNFKGIDKSTQSQGETIFNQLLKSYSKGADITIGLFHPEAVIVFPYASSLGAVGEMNYEEWYNHLKGILTSMPDIRFENVRVYTVDENTYWAETSGETIIPDTGKLYAQKWVMFFTLKEGKINFYKEYWDPCAFLKAFEK